MLRADNATRFEEMQRYLEELIDENPGDIKYRVIFRRVLTEYFRGFTKRKEDGSADRKE
jgi:vacuolar-type H+-ATPase catalytic subunit A/Vma1